jgi:hypothetical protein
METEGLVPYSQKATTELDPQIIPPTPSHHIHIGFILMQYSVPIYAAVNIRLLRKYE